MNHRLLVLAKECFDVKPALAQLAQHPELWNQFTARTLAYQHSQIDDIWVRYNAWENFDPANPVSFNEPHEAVWYPAGRVLTEVRKLAFDLMRLVEGERLGGVLITRIPPGKRVEPHIDQGWHASYYDKFAIQLKGDRAQAFCFEGEAHVTEPGDLYTFDNSKSHWVTNDSTHERITLIVCIRLDQPGKFLC